MDHQEDVIELGDASETTKGPHGNWVDFSLGMNPTGLADE